MVLTHVTSQSIIFINNLSCAAAQLDGVSAKPKEARAALTNHALTPEAHIGPHILRRYM